MVWGPPEVVVQVPSVESSGGLGATWRAEWATATVPLRDRPVRDNRARRALVALLLTDCVT